MSTDATTVTDFFISYTSADEGWATWIAWQLEHAGYGTIIQAWDFRPGSNFALEMDEAARRASRTLLVLSPDFVKSAFVQPEWAAAFAQDPTGRSRRLVPVVVAETEIPPMLRQIVHINLVGLDRDAAARKLLAGVDPARSKPASEPAFPGEPTDTSTPTITSTSKPREFALDWRPAQGTSTPVSRASLLPRGTTTTYRASLEITLVPETPQSLRVGQLADLAESMTIEGRRVGLFPQQLSVEQAHTADSAYVFRELDRSAEEAGLLISRTGQRTAWVSLPSDNLGSVFDASKTEPRIAALLRILAGIDAPLPERFTFTATVAPLMMLSVGDADVVGRRTSASMRSGRSDPFPLAMPDSVVAAAVIERADELAAELTARIVAALS